MKEDFTDYYLEVIKYEIYIFMQNFLFLRLCEPQILMSSKVYNFEILIIIVLVLFID